MIEIIEHGKEKFTMICPRCGCKFTYQIEDLNFINRVNCPDCNKECLHPEQDGVSTPMLNQGVPLPYYPDTTPLNPYNPWDNIIYENPQTGFNVSTTHSETITESNDLQTRIKI